MNIKHIATLTAAVAGMFAATTRADVDIPAALEELEDDGILSAEIALDVVSRQLTRGMVDNKDPVFELGGQVNLWDFYFNVTGIFDLTDWGETDGGYGDREWEYKELDLTIGYGFELSPEDFDFMPTTLAIDVSYQYQYYPRSLEDDTVDTQVIAFEFCLADILLEPTLAIEWDIQDEDGAVYANFGLSHSFELMADDTSELALTLGGNIGFGNTTRNDLDAGYTTAGFTDFEIGVSLDYTCGAFSISPFFAIADQLDGRRRDAAREADGSRSTQYYGGVSCALSF